MKLEYSLKRVGGLSLHTAESASDEPTLVMLHGVTRRWQTFLPLIPALAVRHRMMLVDFRGHGQSERASSGYQVCDYVDDICTLIEEHVTGTVAVYGHSLGAMTAAGVAARLGARLSAVIMEDPPLETMGSRIATTPLLSYFEGVSRFAGDRRPVHELAVELGDVRFRDPVSGAEFRAGDTRDQAQLRFAAASLKQLDPAVFAPILKAEWLAGYDVEHVFRHLACPALLLQADDTAGGMLTADDAEHVAALNPLLARVSFPGVGHGIHWTATPQLLNTVLPFLESVR